MASKRAAKRGRKSGILTGSDGSVQLGLNGVPVEPQVTEKPPPGPQVTENSPPEQEEVAMAGKRAAKRGRKPGIPAGSGCSVELGLNGVPVEPQVAEKPPPEPAEEVEDGEAEEVEGSQQSDLHSSIKEGLGLLDEDEEEGDESMEEEAADELSSALQSLSKGRNGVKKPAPSARVAEARKPPPSGNNKRRSNEVGEQSDLQSAGKSTESMEEEAAGESASALQSPSKGKRGGKKPAPSARDVEAEKSPPPGNRRRNQEPVPCPSPNKRNMLTKSHRTEVPSPSPNKRNMVTRLLKPEVPAPEEHEPEDKGHEPEDQEEHEQEHEGAGIIKLKKKKSKKMRKSAPEEHGPEDEGHDPEDPEEHGPEDEGAGIIKLKNKNNKKMRKPAPEEHEPEDQGAEVIKFKKRKLERIKPAQQQGEPGTSKVKRIRREWAPNDEILILEQVVNYRHTHGDPPEVKDSGFFESVLKQLGDQSLELRSVKDKMCSLRRRYFENKHKSTTEHGKRLDNLSEQAWGKPSQVGAKDSSGSNLSKKALRKHSRAGAKDSNGSKTGGKSFEEMCEMYPLLAQEVELIADIDPSAKSSFTRIDAEVACKLEKQLDVAKAQISQVRQALAGVWPEAC